MRFRPQATQCCVDEAPPRVARIAACFRPEQRRGTRKLCTAIRAALLAFAFLVVGIRSGVACPFCTAVEPSLTERREAAAVAALGELIESDAKARIYRLHKVSKGADQLADPAQLDLPPDKSARVGDLALLLGDVSTNSGDSSDQKAGLTWTATPLDEAAIAYLFRAPSLRTPTAERLKHFAPFLEHANPLIAEDAYREFGRAPFDAVASAADALPLDRMRDWLVDPAIPQARQGFYGMALGLARSEEERGEHAGFLRAQIEKPANDYRAGFDGLLGGYLLAAGPQGLELIESRYLANPEAANGDVRHAMTALRFYHEYGRDIPRDRLATALRQVLVRPEFAADAIADLARWEDWSALDQVALLFAAPGYDDGPTRRAVVGYLLASPDAAAKATLARLRRSHATAVAEAEKQLSLLGTAR